MEREAEDLRKFAIIPFLLKLLPVRDDIVRAMGHLHDDDGLRQILGKLDRVLAEAGVTPMTALGKPLDPKKHEVLSTAPGEKNRVLAVHEEGYELQGRVLRPAKVQVGDGNLTATPATTTESAPPSAGAE
jgi:molecular chaperone GrpE